MALMSCHILAQEAATTAGERSLSFTEDVRPILSSMCFDCHGPDEASRQADLRLDIADASRHVLSGTVPELLRRLTSEDPDLRMPPASHPRTLNSEQLDILVQWVKSGARFEQHWSFRPIERPMPPRVAGDAWCQTPVDHFVLAKMQAEGLTPNEPADDLTLIRRMSLDLNGLPPSREARASFLRIRKERGRQQALDWLVGRLLASPSYAEHMAVGWMEAARYADTDGYQNDRYRYQSAWRDWVLKAFNEKMPYDQFVIEQLAGDLLPDPSLWQQVATGFGRNHRINSEDGSIPDEWLVENVVDRVDTFGTVFLGLTMGCARCHDHKYDPVSQQDYYQLFAYFNNIAEHGVGPNNGNSPPFIRLPDSWPLIDEPDDHFVVPEPVKLKRAREASGNGLTRPQPGDPGTVMVMHELTQPRSTFLLQRGRYDMPDRSVPLQPAIPQALQAPASEGSQAEERASRLDLAEWVVSRQNPLAARVAVNRLWQQCFGTGLVRTAENFGAQGSPPSHPDLLDWLAVELIDSGWDLQHIQRMILASACYQQSSRLPAGQRGIDPENRWLARGPRNRLTPFALRDQALAVSGLMVARTGGPSVKPYMPPKIWSAISNNKYEQGHGADLFRRSLYTYWRRTIPPPTMMNFNAANREVCIVRNEMTNTPLQALTLLNNKLFVEAARHLAARVERSGVTGVHARLTALFELATSRQPTPRELDSLVQAYQSLQKAMGGPQAAALLQIGESPVLNSEGVESAALTLAASIVLNLDAVVTKE